ncbi:chemotaxis protein CheC [Iodobacter fluviatilis]|uniref:CheC inhibitor of MCP methylation n=1 Tax=Iodobacter fluviatilis TaxID=537 RepID=A0A377Q829_9NEIS|nr:chemotaxis protein CheC [Iodobacter fluviatilis]TCU88864.1 CheC inhibitor of MCP methylation [Iodobacter fluviatilis]STQ91063.1 flagellar motor switch protein [Iodobacter fluviatilis]
MNEELFLTEEQTDALQEITNIAMGRAGAQLAQILDTFIKLSVPRINIIQSSSVSSNILKMIGSKSAATAIRQSFNGSLSGEAMVVYDQHGCRNLADLMGYDGVIDRTSERELLLDVGNVLVGACLNGVADLLGASLVYSAPTIMAENVEVDKLINIKQITWNYALLVEVHFTLEIRDFTCHLLTLMPEESILRLQLAIDAFMEKI